MSVGLLAKHLQHIVLVYLRVVGGGEVEIIYREVLRNIACLADEFFLYGEVVGVDGVVILVIYIAVGEEHQQLVVPAAEDGVSLVGEAVEHRRHGTVDIWREHLAILGIDVGAKWRLWRDVVVHYVVGGGHCG